jgi:transposase
MTAPTTPVPIVISTNGFGFGSPEISEWARTACGEGFERARIARRHRSIGRLASRRIERENRPELAVAVTPLLITRVAIEQQIADLDRKVMKLARSNAQVRQFMTAPGIGPVTALCFLATIDDPTRFKKSRSVGAYVGLTTRRYASGEIDWTGRISKCGDKMLRSYPYEAANVLLTRVAKWSALKA